MNVVFDNVGLYADGIRTTVVLTLASFAVALVVGTAVAAARVSPVPPLRVAGAVWVEVIRNTPLAVQFIIFFFGFTKVGIQYPAFTSSIIVLSTYTSSFVAETLRSGVNSVSVGQAEAGRSLGLRFSQLLAAVVLPQAFRTVVGPLGSVFIALTKNSSLASIISVLELTEVADRLSNATARPIQVFAGAAIGYLILTLPSGWAFGFIERKVAIRR